MHSRTAGVHFGFALLAVVLSVGSLQAQSVEYVLTVDGALGSFELTALASDGDNAGLATFGVPLVGDFTSILNVSPAAAFVTAGGNAGPAGFNFVRSAEDAPLVTGGHNTTDAAFNLVYGLGQTPGSFEERGWMTANPTSPEWDVPVVLATGTFDPTNVDGIGIDTASVDLIANVFVDTSGAATSAAEVSAMVVGGGGGDNTAPVGDDASLDAMTDRLLSHQFTATDAESDPLTWSDLVFTALNGADPGPNAPTLSAAGLFEWDRGGADLGTYTAMATVSDGDLTGSALLTIDGTTAIPEPASALLIGLAMVGLGFIRRR
jgi:hypothetical protein